MDAWLGVLPASGPVSVSWSSFEDLSLRSHTVCVTLNQEEGCNVELSTTEPHELSVGLNQQESEPSAAHAHCYVAFWEWEGVLF